MDGLNVKLQVFSSQSASYANHRRTFVVVYLQDKELNEKCTIHNIYIHLPPWPTAQVLQCCCRFFPILYGKIDFANVGPLGSSPLELLSPYSCESLAFLCPIGLSAYRTYNQCLYNAVTWGTTLHISQKFAKPSISHPAVFSFDAYDAKQI